MEIMDYPKAYAFKLKNKKDRLQSQSGGAFAALATMAVKQGWIVYGVVFKKPYSTYCRVDSQDKITALCGSKYVQAELNCLHDIENDLNEGRDVLFCGTPCYVSVVKNYCRNKFLNLNKLHTIDFFCRGVPSKELFRYFLEWFEIENNIHCKNFIF